MPIEYENQPLFFNSLLLYSQDTMEKLTNSRVAIAGVGGVGSIAIELLVRTGIGHIKIADPDCYEPRNLNRQLFATTRTIGQKKALAAASRLKEINPKCRIEVFTEGVNLTNIRQFCENIDVILCVADKESVKIILNRVAKENKIPLVIGSRCSLFEHRWKVMSKIWNYRKDPDLPCYDQVKHPEIAAIPFEHLSEEILSQYDEKIVLKKMRLLKNLARENPSLFGSIEQKVLLERVNSFNDFHNRHVMSVIANTGGCFAAAAALKLLLNGPEKDIVADLWNGMEE